MLSEGRIPSDCTRKLKYPLTASSMSYKVHCCYDGLPVISLANLLLGASELESKITNNKLK